MTLSSDLRRIADWLTDIGQDGRAITIRRAADALEWRRVEDGLPEPTVFNKSDTFSYTDPVLTAGDGKGAVIREGCWRTTRHPREWVGWVHTSGEGEPAPTHYMPLPPSPERTRE